MQSDILVATLSEIFSSETGYASNDPDVIASSPDYSKISEFAQLLAESPREEELQQFIESRPEFLMGLYGWGDDSVVAFLTKPSVGILYRADFGILQYGQGGCSIHLVELEPCDVPLFTKRGDRAQRHNGALTQARNWASWIHPNKSGFVRDTLEAVRRLPQYPERSENGSFRRRDYKSIESAWRGFGGFDGAEIDCTIVIGRWSKLDENQQKSLIAQNRHDGKLAKVITYDQLARSAFERPLRNF